MAALSRPKPGAFAARYRAQVALRALLAVVGGYALTAVAVMALARVLPVDRLEATEAATLASFLIYAALVMTAFSVRSLSRLLVAMGLPAVAALAFLVFGGVAA